MTLHLTVPHTARDARIRRGAVSLYCAMQGIPREVVEHNIMHNEYVAARHLAWLEQLAAAVIDGDAG